MKKLLFIILLLSTSCNIFAFCTQVHWRWRKDDGTQTTASWIAARDSAATITSTSAKIRIRFALFNSPGNGSSGLGTSILSYSADGGTTWDSVSNYNNGTRAFVLAGTSAFPILDRDPTTAQISMAGAKFEAGKMQVDSNTLAVHQVAEQDTTEYEWVIKPTSKMLITHTYSFRMDTDNGAKTYGDNMAILKTALSVLATKLTSFTATSEGKKIKLNWTTVSEENNDHFDVEKSSNSTDWKSIATIKGSSNSSSLINYSAYDVTPVSGNNFYRLKQFDRQGNFTLSVIKTLRFDGGDKMVISVSPNPSKGAIQFKLTNINATDVQAVLTDVNGKTIHQQTFKSIVSNTANSLNFKHPVAAGMYILKLQAKGISETTKVIIQ